MRGKSSSPGAGRRSWLSRSGGHQRLFRAVRLLPEVVRVGASLEGTPGIPEDPLAAPPPEEGPQDQEIRLLKEELQRGRDEREELQGALRASA